MAALVVVLVLLLAAVVLHPAAATPRRTDTAPLAGDGALVALLIGGTALLLALTARRFRAETRSVAAPGPVAERLSEAVGWLLPAGAVVVPLALIAVHAYDGGPPNGRVGPLDPLPAVSPVERTKSPYPAPPDLSTDADYHHTTGLNGTVLLWLCLAVTVLLLIALAVALWLRHRDRARLGAAPALIHGAGTRPDPEALADAVASARAALLSDTDPRSAVIACYQAMETSLADAGIEQLDSDSPADLLRRAAHSGRLDVPEAEALAGLFREARYSTHPMNEDHVRRATRALDAIAARLAPEAGAPADAEAVR